MAATRVLAVEGDGAVGEVVPQVDQVRDGHDACRMTFRALPGVGAPHTDGADACRCIVAALPSGLFTLHRHHCRLGLLAADVVRAER